MNIDWKTIKAAVWRPRKEYLRPVRLTDPIRLEDLLGIDGQKAQLQRNTERFLDGMPANNALLWGARGTGKSSLIKALLNRYHERGLRLIQVDKEDLINLPEIVDDIRDLPHRFLVFCDDLSFAAGEPGYKALKSVLEGSVELPPDNVLIYATSNRRHLLPEYMEENQVARRVGDEIHLAEVTEEKISLSDRFGLWLSFYPITQDEYLAIVDHYFAGYRGDRIALHEAAKQFALLRGGRSGRAARQFYNEYSD
jgi:predicted AAA+ superfamily ATPase